ncbi:ATP-grasp domain-containing protein [Herbinix luporum]|jgi:RimK family alpha-L-glutamate ligase|uniref:ATP-grasp domain-containing protein n=1 Tax=Herbinix luporum TaxID=1679721 RepID=A0A0K8J490_9FIRM|nr:RimK family alpha-L-glutamate ligase [Herbinix luporum]MDI9488355.1 RimK family alpha-L-glutamate ligase [Bacillota bacterium]CUH92481.1 hypothetical protein SD1D_0934 [Herbinix luporum]HHT57082.1 RimK family alpha-L-glutamate ligase [Herbinix luporum]
MLAWLIVNEFLESKKFNEIHKYIYEAAKRQGIDLEQKTNAQLLIDLPFKEKTGSSADFILFWDKDVRLAKYLEMKGYKVFNSSDSIYACDDKSKTHILLAGAGIVMPRTIIAPMTYNNIGYTNTGFLDEVADKLGFPLVVKECFGSFGQQVYLVNDFNELTVKVKQLGAKPMLFQEYIRSSHGRDIRLQVVGDKVVAAMYRYSDNGDFRANLTIGGKMKSYEPTKEQCDLAIKSCKILGLDFAGVDILFGKDEEPMVCEVNSNAHFKNIYDCTGVNVADAIINHIKSRL